jgi:hypothetical protein
VFGFAEAAERQLARRDRKRPLPRPRRIPDAGSSINQI